MISQSIGTLFENKSNNFNLLRLVAAFCVIYGHANTITGNDPPDLFLQLVGYKFIGGVAVDVFFVISGFLITSSAMSNKGLFYFLASRVLRIYPALMVCIIFTVFFLGPILSDSMSYWESSQTWEYLWRNSTAYSTEYFLPGVFHNLHDKAVNGSLWSLSIEVRLYLVVFLMAFVFLFKSHSVFNFCFFSLLIVGYLIPEPFLLFFQYENHLHVSMMFMIGMFAWVNRKSIPLNSALLLILLFLAASFHKTPAFGTIYPIVLAYIVLYIAFAPGGEWFNRVGDYSYGVYLYGWLSQQLVFMMLPSVSNIEHTVLSCFLVFGFALLSWHFIEKPSLRLRKHFIGNSIFKVKLLNGVK